MTVSASEGVKTEAAGVEAPHKAKAWDWSALAPSRSVALFLAAAILSGYVVFNYYRVGDELYVLSKTFASFDYRQYLGLSKRWLVQYGHIAFLFPLLVLSKYIFLGDGLPRPFRRFIDIVLPYTLPIFIIHFSLLYFIAAITDHDPHNPVDEIFLFCAVIATSALFGRLCLYLKPLFDQVQKQALDYFARRQAKVAHDGKMSWAKYRVTGSHSEFLKLTRIVATFSIVLGHFSFPQFSDFDIPGFDHWRRWAVPFFFMVSGYFAIMFMDRSKYGALGAVFKRYTSLWFAALPMLLIVPILDHIGFAVDTGLYLKHDTFVVPEEGGPADLPEYFATIVSSLLYLNEIFIFNLLELGTTLGGVRAFSNDSYWFVCYLMPFTALLTVMCRAEGWAKYFWLVVLAAFFGPPILFLSPLFFAGCVAYLIHSRV